LKHILSGLFALLMGIAIALPATVPAQADSTNINTTTAVTIPVLMIKVNNTAEVGQPVTISVFNRHSHESIAGAPIYAIKTSGRVGPADPGNNTTLTDEFEALAESEGISIGTSGSDGTLSATLTEAGRYLLVTAKDGFIPGFARLQVKGGDSKTRLILQAPTSSPAGQQVTIKVTYGISGQAVDNATVSAFKTANLLPPNIKPAPVPAENGTSTQMIIGRQAPIMIDAEQEDALAGQLGKKEIILGRSNSAGEVTYTFNDPGTYMLLVRKGGYLPGARRINIQSSTASKALEIKATINLTTGQSSGIQVTDKSSGQSVEGAAVYSLKVENNGYIKQMPPTANNFKGTIVRALHNADSVREKGVLVGNTDSGGQVSYSFPSPGIYMLAAFKDGFITGITRINILRAASVTTVPVPQPTIITTTE